jgi:prevent-host-death family protein
MYIRAMFMDEVYMSWSVANARARFSELLEAAVRGEPQVVARRGRNVAVVVSAEDFEAFEEWRRERPGQGLAEAIEEVAALCAEDDYELEVPRRRDRRNTFASRR